MCRDFTLRVESCGRDWSATIHGDGFRCWMRRGSLQQLLSDASDVISKAVKMLAAHDSVVGHDLAVTYSCLSDRGRTVAYAAFTTTVMLPGIAAAGDALLVVDELLTRVFSRRRDYAYVLRESTPAAAKLRVLVFARDVSEDLPRAAAEAAEWARDELPHLIRREYEGLVAAAAP